MLSVLRNRRSGLFTLGVALLLLVTTLSTAPVAADTTDPTFTVTRTQWGSWVSGDGWAGTGVQIWVRATDTAEWSEPSTVDFDTGNPGTFGLSLSGDAADIAEGWMVRVSDVDGLGMSHELLVPFLTVDNVHTDDGTVHGSASEGLIFDVEACIDGPNECDVQTGVTGVSGQPWHTTDSLPVSDRLVRAAFTDGDGDRYEHNFAWPSLGYQRTKSAQGIMSHQIHVGQFEPETSVEITVDGPGDTYDRGFSANVDGNGNANVDLVDWDIPPSDEFGNPTVGAGWTFTARANGSDGEPIEKVLVGNGLTLNTVDQIQGKASGDCTDGMVFVNLVRGESSGGDGETQETTCVDDTWTTETWDDDTGTMETWDVDELHIPFVLPGTQDGDGDQFGISWERARIDVGGDVNGYGIGFHFWSPNEDATLQIWDAEDQVVSVLNGGLVPLLSYPDPSDPRIGFWLADFVADPLPPSIDGWEFRVSNSTQVKVLRIADLTIDVAGDGTVAVNELGEISGTAPPNSLLGLSTGDGSGAQTLNADDAGHWAIGTDLSESAEVSVWMDDPDGDWSSVWAPVHGGGGTEISFSVETPNQVWGVGENWPLDETIYLTVDDDEGVSARLRHILRSRLARST